MRVITTWMYFDPSQIEGEMMYRRHRGRGEEVEPGIGIAWCAGDSADLMSISNMKAFRELPGEAQEFSEEAMRRYIDAFLVDVEDFEFVGSWAVRNSAIVDFVINEPFVIERSPPDLLSLKGVITKTNFPIWIGTYMGWSVVPENSVLLFISVPGGIIIVSSAVGLANALASGLGTSVKRLFREKKS